jgi:periplasmic protein TonB
MFSGLTAVEHHPVRKWTAMASFMLQSGVVVAAFVYPLLHPSVLPEAFLRRRIFVPMSSGEVRAESNSNAHPTSTRVFSAPLIVRRGTSFRPSNNTNVGAGPTAPPGIDVVGSGDPSGVLQAFANSGLGPAPHPPMPTHPLMRTSSVMEGLLIHRVQPRYPPIALQTHTQGAVIVSAIIGRDGRIEQAQVIRGQALLNNAALEAVKQWQYRPYYLNGVAIEVETQITVNFVIGR